MTGSSVSGYIGSYTCVYRQIHIYIYMCRAHIIYSLGLRVTVWGFELRVGYDLGVPRWNP